MIQPRRLFIPVLMCLALVLGACKLPATYSPTPEEDFPIHTAAYETIAAQITEIAVTEVLETSPTGASEGSSDSPTETLPATSTPMPTKTPIPSDTPVPSPTQEPTASVPPTEPSEDPKENLGEPSWYDTFDSGMNWPLYYDEHVEMDISAGQLEMRALYADKWDSWMLTKQYPTDFYIEVTATPGECSYLDRYGLLARAPDANRAYLFGFSCDGNYSLRLWTGEKYFMLVPWTPSPQINKGPDETNRLGLMAEGDKLSLYANGRLLTAIKDDTYPEGGIGLFVGAVKTEGFTVLFDEVAYWDLP